jgi:hypothetical protein
VKIVVNRRHGGFGLSEEAATRLGMCADDAYDHFGCFPGNRNDPALVAVVEEMGDAASGPRAELAIVEWPDNLPYRISDYDGIESVEVNLHKLVLLHGEEIAAGATPLARALQSYKFGM